MKFPKFQYSAAVGSDTDTDAAARDVDQVRCQEVDMLKKWTC
jgi:hypothetical protein